MTASSGAEGPSGPGPGCSDEGPWHRAGAVAKKLVRIGLGSIVILAGVVMLVTPGPGIAAIIAGLAIMADEFPPAKRALKYMQHKFIQVKDRALKPRAE
jgi:uncharacterized protein (TIGR02611 family)